MTHANPTNDSKQAWRPWGAVVLALLVATPAAAALLRTPLDTSAVDADLLARLRAQPGATFDAFVTFDHGVGLADAERLQAAGLDVLRVFPAFQVAYVAGTGRSLLEATRLAGVEHLQGNDALQFYSNTATLATRVRDAWDAKSTSTSPVVVGGNVVDGTGVTIAVVDSGLDATHPDFAGAVAANLKYLCSTPGLVSTASDTCYGNAQLFTHFGCSNTVPYWMPLDDTEVTSGHGTHVAGIAAGRGHASDGRFMGAAPDAELIGLGVGEGISILFALEAFNWVNCNAAAFGIDIVQNSWGAAGPYVATDPINMAVTTLVGNGMVVVFSAGNDGPGGTVNQYAKNPTPGVIGVASTYDGDVGARATATVSSYSSQCLATGAASECPDVAAPGERVTAALDRTGPAVFALGLGPHLGYAPYYATIDGTSMAAPHVSGIVALLLEAVPTLTPAAIEDILEDTAEAIAAGAPYGLTDASNPTSMVSIATGHGHVDAIAALESALATTGLGSPQPQVGTQPHVYVGGADGQLLSATQWTVPAGQSVQLSVRNLASGDAAWPLATGQACQFLVGAVVVPCAPAGVTGVAPAQRMDAAYIFAAGTHTVEAHVMWGGTYHAVDSFVVDAV